MGTQLSRFASIGVGFYLGCGGSNPSQDARTIDAAEIDAAPDIDPSLITPGCFTGGDPPQIDLSGPVANWTWNDPHVVRAGAAYWMYASATDYFDFPVRLYRLTSNDGATWTPNPTPILDVGAPGTWDAGGVETPAVVFWHGQYHLFYTGYPYPVDDPNYDVADFRVGHATSTDGATFTRTPTPVVAPSGTDSDPTNDWDAFIVGEPGPVVHDDTLYLYFTAVGVTDGAALQVIGVTTTTDGTTWTPPVLALAPDQSIYPRTDDWVGYSTPNAIELAGEIHLFVDVAHQPDGAPWRQLRLHHAHSADGTIWSTDPTPLRSAGDFAWAVDEIRSPDALLEGTTLRLYIAGHELDGTPPDHFAIGMLTCEL